MKEDTPLGKAVLTLGAKLEGSQEHELDIVRPDGRIHGKVIVHVSYCPKECLLLYFLFMRDYVMRKSREEEGGKR